MPHSADRLIVRLCLAAALVWAAAIPLAAYAVSRHPPGGTLLATMVYGIGAVACHQRPERSFSTWGVAWPVCARCAGIYLGAAAVGLASFAWHPPRRLAKALPAGSRWILAFAALPSLVTLLMEWVTGAVPSNATRFVAGVPIGAAILGVIASSAGRPARPAASDA